MTEFLKVLNFLVTITALADLSCSTREEEIKKLKESTKLNLALIDIYQMLYFDYVEAFPEIAKEDEIYKTAKQKDETRYSFLFQDTTKDVIVEHFLHACYIENRTNLDEKDLIVYLAFLNSKVSAFIHGLNYLNGSILLDSGDQVGHICEVFGNDLLQFGVTGTEEVTGTFIKLLKQLNGGKEHNISNILTKGVKEMWTIFLELNEYKLFCEKNGVLLSEYNKANYQKLISAETNLMNGDLELLVKLLEIIKLKSPSQLIKSVPTKEIIIPYEKAQSFWDDGKNICQITENDVFDDDIMTKCDLTEVCTDAEVSRLKTETKVNQDSDDLEDQTSNEEYSQFTISFKDIPNNNS